MQGQPPLLVFTLCLMAFGLTMVILAYVVGKFEIPNPDVYMDWNNFFAKISSFDMCILPNRTVLHGNNSGVFNSISSNNATIINEKSMSAVLSKVVSYDKSDDSDFSETSVTVSFQMPRKLPLELSSFKGHLKGHQLGFSDKFSYHLFNISMNFDFVQNSSSGNEMASYDVCLTVNLPYTYLHEIKSPKMCKSKDSSQENVPIYFSKVRGTKESCFVLGYSPDANLNEMLSFHDRSLVNVHLMHTSYFMFVMVITLVCYSIIKGKHRYAKTTLEKV